MRKNYYKFGTLFLLMYTVTCRKSFEAMEFYYKQLQSARNYEEFPAIVIGNMNDLEDLRVVSFEEGKKWADDRKFPFVETSAKTGCNVYYGFLFF